AQGSDHPCHRRRPRGTGGGERTDLRAFPPCRRRLGASGRRAGSGDRAWLRRGERWASLGGGGSRPGRNICAFPPGCRGAGRGAGLSGERVLVVDDEPQFRRALVTNLRGAGYDVEAAATAGEALTSAGLRAPELVILDLVLPDGRGTDVARELRKWTEAPIIL